MPSLVNSYPHWEQITTKENKQSIWFDINSSRWTIGCSEHIGSNIGEIIGPATNDNWPQNISSWYYFNFYCKEWIQTYSNVQISDFEIEHSSLEEELSVKCELPTVISSTRLYPCTYTKIIFRHISIIRVCKIPIYFQYRYSVFVGIEFSIPVLIPVSIFHL